MLTLYAVILNTHYVILNEVKNLKVSETVDGSANLEILRDAQDDRAVRMRLPRLGTSLAMTEYSITLTMTHTTTSFRGA